jgi:type IV pilus modification protein PilV
MKTSHTPIKNLTNRGFTLLEIMIAILIMAIGLAAMANLQGKLTRYSTMAKQRTIAMNLLEQQAETMRSFYTMQDTGAGACSTEQSGFDDLESCVNGTTVSVGNMPFNLSWTIAAYSQNYDGTTEVYSTESERFRADLKLATISVNWVGGLGEAQSAELVDIIDATSVFNTGRVAAKVDSNTRPSVPFDIGDFPGVVEIAIGSDKVKGSTTPKPTIENRGENVITKFDVVSLLSNGTDAYLQRREEFKVVNCICTMDNGLGTGREVGKGRAPSIWNGTYYALGEKLSKRTGTPLADQPYECGLCCGDHHDAAGADDKYDNFRPAFSGDAGGFDFLGDHAHYGIVNGVKVLAKETDEYLEACRFIRKDGLFKLTTDMAQENLDAVRESYPTTFNTQYSNSVINFVTDFSNAISVLDYPGTRPVATYSVPWWLDWWGIFLNSPGQTEPSMSRAIYVDYLSADLLKKIKCLQADGLGDYSDFCDILKDPPWLEILPFYDVDLTSLANWNRGSTSISVTNSPISDIDRAGFSRGVVGLAPGYFDIDTNVSASVELSNTGLTDTNPIDPDDELESTGDMPVRVVIGGSLPAIGAQVTGNIYAGSNKVNVETVRLQQNPPDIDCEIITIVDGNSTQKAYVCDLYPTPVTGTITVSDYNATKVTNVVTVLNRKVCPDSALYFSMEVFNDNTVADPDLNFPGETTVFTFSSLVDAISMNITIEEEADNCP